VAERVKDWTRGRKGQKEEARKRTGKRRGKEGMRKWLPLSLGLVPPVFRVVGRESSVLVCCRLPGKTRKLNWKTWKSQGLLFNQMSGNPEPVQLTMLSYCKF
jgi:hypothetical protein